MLLSLRRSAALAGLCFASAAASASPTSSPTGFIENKGQIHTPAGAAVPAVRYLLSLPGLNVQLRGDGFSYDAWTRTGERKAPPANTLRKTKEKAASEKISYSFHRVDVGFVGARVGAMLQPAEAGTDLLNYYSPSAPDGVTGVRHFSTVTYREVWPHIDVEFVAAPGKAKPVEYNFILHPGAQVSDIQLRYEGADESSLKNDGLHLKTAVGTLTENIPASYWASTKAPVEAHYSIVAKDAKGITIGFATAAGSGPLSSELIIDPTPNISWATYYGGSDFDFITGTAGDSIGNSYATGSAGSVASIATTGAHQTTNVVGQMSSFLVKFNAGGARQWATYYGGSFDDGGYGIAATPTGSSVFMAGYTIASTGIATTGAHQTAYGGGDYDGYLVRFNNLGVRQWGTYYGGTEMDYVAGVALDAAGNPHVSGVTLSATGIASANAHQSVYGSISGQGVPGDAFIVKFNAAGARQWGTYYGGVDEDYGYGIGVDAAGNVYSTGATYSTTSIATAGAHQTAIGSGFNGDAFVVKLNSSGVRQWGTYYGGSAEEYGYGVAARPNGDLYICGTTLSGNAIATPGSHQPNAGGLAGLDFDAFLVKFNTGGVRQWGTFYGGSSDEEAYGVATDSAGNVYLAGSTYSANGIATPGAYKSGIGGNGDGDAFFAMFNPSGARQWGSYFGGPETETVYFNCLSISGAGSIQLGGKTRSTTSIAVNGHQPNIGGAANDDDGFMARFTNCISTTTPPTVTVAASPGTPVCVKTPITFTATPGAGTGTTTLRWLVNGQPVAGATGTTFTSSSLFNGNQVRVVISKAGSCGDTLRDSAIINIANLLPLPTPTVNATGSLLTTQPFSAYQWMRNGAVIPGATSQSFTATQAGAYRVIATGTNGCKDTSAIFNFTPTAVKDVQGVGAAIRFFPNPTVGTLNIESPVAVDAVVRGMDGREVMRMKDARTLSLGALPDGLYFVSLTEQRTGAVLRVEKIIKRQ